ncbi:MAG: hypothetical protein EXR66_08045 [Dehalococcoidia bacterium]|nr:hypothetical protein [Dehalococcoidia bacterium]
MVTRDLGGYRILARRMIEDGLSHPGLVLVSEQSFSERDPRAPARLFTALLALREATPDLEGREHWLR